MNQQLLITQLAEHLNTFTSLFTHCEEEHIHWKPLPEKWSLLEVVNHLYDEEREDFRYRLKAVLEHSTTPWPPIAPQKWVTERAYSTRNYESSVTNFLTERTASITWLQGLANPDWNASYYHPHIGAMSAEMLLVNWIAHDYLHIE